ncbi:MAG TPA: TonB-dependent receptor [Steroidobacteraceae bacterium]|nr:TonB-dependent receptor [Steroidobacteraceae bacterium]
MTSLNRPGGAALAALTAACLSSGTVLAQDQTAQTTANPPPREAETIDDTIVITGTSIKGVTPIGSNVMSVGVDELEKTAATNLSTLVNTIPALSTNGSLAQGENLWSFYSPQIHQLGGSSSNTTLVVIDGMRMPGGGAQFNQTDPNIIPTSAMQRVDVLADGASSVYGSDAVAGVVNFITRRTYDGLSINSQYGNADSYDTWDLNGIWGTTWDTGGVYIAAQYSHASQLFVKDRDWASRGDYRDVGGSNTNGFTCAPATMRVTAVSSGTAPGTGQVFLSPDATTSVPNNAATNGVCNLSVYNSFIPSQYRANGLIRVVNDFTDQLSISASLNYNRNQTHADSGPGQLNNATAFGEGAGVAGQQNPFFTAPAGAPDATTELVNWLALRDDGKYGYTESQQDVVYANVVLDYHLNDKWTLTAADSIGWNRSSLDGFKQFCAPCAMLALNGTTQATGSTTASSIPGQNVVVLQLPLTTSNALDVWNTGAANQTNPLLLKSLYTNNTQNNNYNTFNQFRVVMQGELFDMPAGPFKIAFGGEHMWQEQQFKLSGGNNTGPTTTGSGYRVYNFDRDIVSAFAEVAVPLVSPDWDVPALNKLDLSLSVRYDDFSDVGDTTNPRYGINWNITEGFRVRANYAESFVAPPIAVIGDASQGYLYASGSVTSTGTLNVPVALYPEVVNVPGAVVANTNDPCTPTSTSCTIGQNNSAMRRQLGGGFSQMGPQFGESYSFGIDLMPAALEGFRASVTYFHNDFTGGVNSPSPASITASGSPLLTLCPTPTGCTQEQILEFANVANGATIGGTIPANVYYLIDQSSRNWLNLSIAGFDAQIDYAFNVGDKVRGRVGTAGTYFTDFDQFFGTNPSFSVLNTSGFNGVFSSIQTKARSYVGFDFGKFSTDLYWNYIGSYHNWGGSTIEPLQRDENGNPNGGGDRVDATNTFDLHLTYKLELGGIIEDMSLSLDVRNLTDEDPSFFNGNQGGFMGGAWGYDNYTANPVGRLITLGIRTNF